MKMRNPEQFPLQAESSASGKKREAGHNSGLSKRTTHFKSLLMVTTANDIRLTNRRFTASHQFW
jgi:hypothetical protein